MCYSLDFLCPHSAHVFEGFDLSPQYYWEVLQPIGGRTLWTEIRPVGACPRIGMLRHPPPRLSLLPDCYEGNSLALPLAPTIHSTLCVPGPYVLC